MPRYRVKSGRMKRFVEADDARAACVAAVKQERDSEKPAILGQIMEVIDLSEDSDLEPLYISTEQACRSAGCWAESEATP